MVCLYAKSLKLLMCTPALENVYNVIDNKVTIEKLTKSHKDLSFKCIAIQKISVKDHYNATTTSEHKLTVDVYCAFYQL